MAHLVASHEFQNGLSPALGLLILDGLRCLQLIESDDGGQDLHDVVNADALGKQLGCSGLSEQQEVRTRGLNGDIRRPRTVHHHIQPLATLNWHCNHAGW